MFPAETFRDTLTRLVEILHRQGIRFHLTGGVTSIAYGEPRMTQDVDLVVDPRALAADVNVFLAAAETAGFLVDRDTARKAVANGGMFQMLDLAESLKGQQAGGAAATHTFVQDADETAMCHNGHGASDSAPGEIEPRSAEIGEIALEQRPGSGAPADFTRRRLSMASGMTMEAHEA